VQLIAHGAEDQWKGYASMVIGKPIFWVVVCSVLSACQPAAEGVAGPVGLASRLIGHEFAVVPFSDLVGEGLGCKFASSGSVWQAGVERPGWVRGLLLCGDGVPYLFLAKHIGVTQFAMAGGETPQPYPRNKILAVQKLPEVANFSTDPERPGLLELVDSFAGQCDLDGGEGSSFVALVRWDGESEVQGPPGVQAGWGFDVETARVVPLDPRRLTCEPMLMD
jgi:hypothetical protein